MKLLVRGLLAGAWLAAGMMFVGCSSTNQSQLRAPAGPAATVARFRVGDTVDVTFSGAPIPIDPHEETIKEDGTITLPLIGSVYAVGKTTGELQNEIHTDYVPRYYVRLTITVKSGDRVYYVGGEVKGPGPQLYRGDTTVTKAIQSAGGLTDFANHGKVWIIRGGKRVRVDYDKALEDPTKDPLVYPDDQINVDKSLF